MLRVLLRIRRHLAVGAPSGGGGGGLGSLIGGGSDEDYDKFDVKVIFRRLDDQFHRRAEHELRGVHLDVTGGKESMKLVKEAHKKAEKAKKEKQKKKREEMEERVRKDLESGIDPSLLGRNYRPIAFLVRFDGGTTLSGGGAMGLLRKQVSVVVNCGRPGVDEVVVVVTSPGGAVSDYGLAASQLARVRKAGIRLTVCVDTVAASGGYMMASVGDRICAAPFAVIGSIGVVAQTANFQRFLNKHDVDAFLFTAGKHKRTVDLIGDVTEAGKQKFREELSDIHRAFKDHVALSRPALKGTIEEVATGEFWMAVQARELGLVDEIMTSGEYLESVCSEKDVIEIVEKKRKRLGLLWQSALDKPVLRLENTLKKALDRRHQGSLSPTPMAIV